MLYHLPCCIIIRVVSSSVLYHHPCCIIIRVVSSKATRRHSTKHKAVDHDNEGERSTGKALAGKDVDERHGRCFRSACVFGHYHSLGVFRFFYWYRIFFLSALCVPQMLVFIVPTPWRTSLKRAGRDRTQRLVRPLVFSQQCVVARKSGLRGNRPIFASSTALLLLRFAFDVSLWDLCLDNFQRRGRDVLAAR